MVNAQESGPVVLKLIAERKFAEHRFEDAKTLLEEERHALKSILNDECDESQEDSLASGSSKHTRFYRASALKNVHHRKAFLLRSLLELKTGCAMRSDTM